MLTRSPPLRRSTLGLSLLGSRVVVHPPRTTLSVPKGTTSSIWTHITPDPLCRCGLHLGSMKVATTESQNLRAPSAPHHPPLKGRPALRHPHPATEAAVRVGSGHHITKPLFRPPALRILTVVGSPIWTNASLECLLARYYRVLKRTWTRFSNTT